ncbi:tetratricopeptide repeat protein [Patescibacteria group bacterium]|nr:tetratricopeptide repeat protein [Patescibacteria group bacterium]
MITYIVLISIIVITAGVVIFYYLKNKSKLASLDLESMKGHRHKEVKKRVVETRMERKYSGFKNKVKPVFDKISNPLKKFFHNIYTRIMRLERKYKEEEKKEPKTLEQKEIVRQNINQMISDGTDLMEKEDYSGAEKKFIEVLSIDPQNPNAYKKLSDVYFFQKDYEHAKETLEFLININPNDEMIWRDLGKVLVAQDKKEEGLKNYQKAMELAPNNPKNIVLVLETALDIKDKPVANDALNKLKEVNPDNQKLNEYLEKFENL